MTALINQKPDEIMAMLCDKSSSKRRLAARQLRKLKDPDSGAALLEALQKELKDSRTWETQYQMIMALSACKFRDALGQLKKLTQEKGTLEPTVRFAIGYALVELGQKHANDSEPLLALVSADDHELITGGLLAIAMLRIVLDENAAIEVFNYLLNRSSNSWDYYYTAIAAAAWKYPAALSFLHSDCLENCQSGLRAEQPKGAACPKSHLERAVVSVCYLTSSKFDQFEASASAAFLLFMT